MSNVFLRVFSITVLFIFLNASSIYAEDDTNTPSLVDPKTNITCGSNQWFHYKNPTRARPYRINTSSFYTTTQDKARWAIMSAVDIWNTQASSGIYQSVGDTYKFFHYSQSGPIPGTIPLFEGTCSLQGIEWSIFMSDELGGPDGSAWGNCCEYFAWDECNHAAIWLDTGFVYSASFEDFVEVTAHEIGHTYNIGHPDNGETAVMCTSLTNCSHIIGYPRLSEYDTVCARRKAGQRQNYIPSHVLQRDTGFFPTYGAAYLDDFLGIDVVEVGMDIQNDLVVMASIIGKPYGGVWENWGGISRIIDIFEEDSIGPLPMFWQEFSPFKNWYLYFDHRDYCGITDPYTEHLLVYAQSTNNFQGSVYYGNLYTCGDMSENPGDWNQCIGTSKPIMSSRRPSKTYNENVGVTILSWVNTDHTYGAEKRNVVYVSFGKIYEEILPSPQSIKHREGSPLSANDRGTLALAENSVP